ncbi:amine sulfotransferase-like [Amblyomma americanum]
MDPEAYLSIEGLPFLKFFDEGIVRSAMNYEPQVDDVIIASYPKSGTTWAQFIAASIFTSGNPPKTTLDFMLSSPFIDLMGVDAVLQMPRPGAFISHLPFDKRKHSTQAKYIYIARNPYDCCVSFYHFMKHFTPKDWQDVSFDSFLNVFLSGSLLYGDYFDHLLSWYPHRYDPNVLFLTYENLKKETPYWVLRIADFLGKEYGSALRKNEAFLNKVLDSCSPQNMKPVFKDPTHVWVRKALDLPRERRIASMEVLRNNPAYKMEMHRGGSFVRKGIVGDWKSHFSGEQVERMKARIAEKTKGNPEVMNVWKSLDLPM